MKNNSEHILKYDYMSARESRVEDMKKASVIGRGQLILTDTALVFVKFGMGEPLISGAIGAKYATPDRIKSCLSKQGSFSVPLHEIVDFKSGRQYTIPYLVVASKNSAGTHYYRFDLFRKIDLLNLSIADKWVNSIESARANQKGPLKVVAPAGNDRNLNKNKASQAVLSDQAPEGPAQSSFSAGASLPEMSFKKNAHVTGQPGIKDSFFQPAHAKLKIKLTGGSGAVFSIMRNPCLIGRSDTDKYVFPDIDLAGVDPGNYVSRTHARILFNDGKYFIEDLGSVNGTFINRGPRLTANKPHEIKKGDEIVVGRTFTIFEA